MLPRAGADTIRRRWTPPESGQSPQYSGFLHRSWIPLMSPVDPKSPWVSGRFLDAKFRRTHPCMVCSLIVRKIPPTYITRARLHAIAAKRDNSARCRPNRSEAAPCCDFPV
jgi:hypothetical protein